MLLVHNQDAQVLGPGALVLAAGGGGATDDVWCLVIPRRLLSSNASDDVEHVNVYVYGSPRRDYLSLTSECVSRVWSSARFAATLVELTRPVVHWLLARGATYSAPGAALDGTRATRVLCDSDVTPDPTKSLQEESVEIGNLMNDSSPGDALLFGSNGSLLAVESKPPGVREPIYPRKSQVFSMDRIVKRFLEDRSRERRQVFSFVFIFK